MEAGRVSSTPPIAWRNAAFCSGSSLVNVVAVLVEQRDVYVQSVPGLARIGLGHESGVHLVVVGDVLDQALEQHRIVAGLHRVGDVMQVDLELRRCGFGDDGVGRDALGAGAVDDVLEALDVFVEVVDGVHLHRLRTLAGDRRARRLRPAVHVLLVDQVELQLEGGDDGQFHLGEPGHHLAQDFAGSAKKDHLPAHAWSSAVARSGASARVPWRGCRGSGSRSGRRRRCRDPGRYSLRWSR